MALLKQWHGMAYSETANKGDLQRLWTTYFQKEKDIYAELLKNPDEVVEGTVKELADRFGVDLMTMTGFLDGINESLKEANPIEEMEEDTRVNLGFDKELLYKNMVAAGADWLYGLEAWMEILDEETRKRLYREQKSSTTVVKGEKIYPNDPSPCGSGKKYKKCHSSFDERLERLWEEGWNVLPRTLYKTPADIEGIKRSAAINVGVLDYVGEHITAGMTTNQIDQMIYDYTVEHGGTPADLNYEGYPKSVCTSINDVVCHGIPCDTDVLHEGDIINVDCSTILDGYFSDSSRMFCIGKVSAERQRLVDVTRASVEAGLAAVKPWLPLSVMAEAVQKTVEDAGFSVVREYGGHGIGKEFHEDPFVGFTTEAPDVDTIMVPGMVFTIEPMVNAGAPDIKISKGDGWCVRTKDGSDSAQCEVQLVVTEDGHELLSW
ncbi:MAG: type I methionyl aminopeptidase [Collinsella sp.]|nr:type I methionyl aminopeptidase [Collinsella sp.]